MKKTVYLILLVLISCGTANNKRVLPNVTEDQNMIIRTIKGEGICTLSENISINQAKEIALKNAKNDVIQKAETKVTSFTYSYLSEKNEDINEKFSNLIMQHSQAKILEILEKEINREEFSNIQIYHAYIEAKVGIPKEKAVEKSFYIEAKLCNKDGNQQENFVDGEEVQINLESTGDCYIYIYNIFDDGTKFQMIYPYNNQPISIKQFTEIILPDTKTYKSALVLEYIGNGKTPSEEEYFILATLNEADVMKLFNDPEYEYDEEKQLYQVNRDDMSTGEFYRKVFNLKSEEMAWFVLPYKVFPRE